MTPVTDPKDTRVLIPRVRRGIEGAGVSSPAIEDEGVNGLIADAIASIIFFTGGLWGHQLNVTARDTTYMAPTAWQIDPELTEAEGTLIVIQAQLDFLFNDLKSTKIQESIRDESSEWSYSLSATALTELLKQLRKQREEALEAILAENAPMDAWINTLYERDAYTDAMIEPYAVSGGLGGQEFGDPRFG